MAKPRQTIAQQANDIAKRRFGYDALKPVQLATIESVMSGNDTWVNLRTGEGKSACFQIPCLMSDGLVLVFSPLIALMKDQVDKLRAWGLRAERLSSDMPDTDVRRVIRDMNRLDILYIAPERLKSGDFLRRIRQVDVSFVVLDEAHVLSHAIQDFRPAYAMVGRLLKKYLKEVPRMALTATADDEIERTVVRVLGMRNYTRVTADPTRPNLVYEVSREWAAADFVRWIRQNDFDEGVTGLVYASTRARVMQLAKDLASRGLNVEPYHAGIGDRLRTEVQDRWINNTTRIIVATNAFGMGVDKPDVRFVVHADPPGSIHNFAQESGRAGRDGQESKCLLNMTASGLKSRRFFIKTSNPDIALYDAVWSMLTEKSTIGEGFRLSSYDVCKTLRECGINAYDAPHYVPNILGYFEYNGDITTKPDKVVHVMDIQNVGKFSEFLQRWSEQIEVKDNAAKITVYPGDADFAGAMLATGACTREWAPNEVLRALRRSDKHTVKAADLDAKRLSAELRLELLVQFSVATDKQAFFHRVFGESRVERVGMKEKECPSTSITQTESQQPLLPWESSQTPHSQPTSPDVSGRNLAVVPTAIRT